jgi:hypothetical protein
MEEPISWEDDTVWGTRSHTHTHTHTHTEDGFIDIKFTYYILNPFKV